ncbi:hypothetical protein ON010_g13751 [Phytophthora cinnamomi]|nr:hypothetical protein ON010_g13751 [Phytophthora cinnamomi]
MDDITAAVLDDTTAVVLAVVLAACVSSVVAMDDQRGLRQPPTATMTFPTYTFERALRTPGTGWFRKKLRCDKKSFLRIYELVHAECPDVALSAGRYLNKPNTTFFGVCASSQLDP